MDTMAPIRSALQHPRRLLLNAVPPAAGEARRQVQAYIYAWEVGVDPQIAALLTSELVTNAIRHGAGEHVMLVMTSADGQLRVDVHDTSTCGPVPMEAPADAETGRGLMLVDSLSADWGFYWTVAGKAVYFTLTIPGG
ncbi:MAG TPA: ATP-binding protein [Streptosporangiaceae bacterium]|nr:ATP-binding protein [Streptosporangiaceae bacterium]